MSRREFLFAAALTVCSGLVVYGVSLIHTPSGVIAAGVLFGVLSFLVLSE